MKKLALLCIAALGLVAVAGCGDDDDGGDGGVPTGDVSKQDYIAEANQVCEEGDTQLDEAARAFFVEELGLGQNERPTDEQIAQFAEEEAIPVIQDQIDKLREIEAPEADADEITEIYNAAQAALDEAVEDPSILATEQTDPFEETNRLAEEYGITECAD
jgi:hypothetical protein